ncbi:MAG: DUF6036 family nucleotidyltransferase, partial [Myxococcaceae bacterium]
LMGGAALILAYGLDRATEDADLLLDDTEAQFLVEQCNFGEALEATNRELEPLGLYLSHIWGPEQQILTPEWRANCRNVSSPLKLSHLTLQTLGPLDLIVSKLARADDGDWEDMRYLIEHERLTLDAVRNAIARALVPEILAETFEESRLRVDEWLTKL